MASVAGVTQDHILCPLRPRPTENRAAHRKEIPAGKEKKQHYGLPAQAMWIRLFASPHQSPCQAQVLHPTDRALARERPVVSHLKSAIPNTRSKTLTLCLYLRLDRGCWAPWPPSRGLLRRAAAAGSRRSCAALCRRQSLRRSLNRWRRLLREEQCRRVRSGVRAEVPVPVPPTATAAGRYVPSLPGCGCAASSSMCGRMAAIAPRSLHSSTNAPGVPLGPTRSARDFNLRGLSILSTSSKAPGGVPLGTARFSSGCNVRGLSILSTSSKKASGNGGGRGLLRFFIVHCAAVAGTIGLSYLVFGKKEEEFLSVDNDSTFPESLDWTLLASFPDIPDRCYNKTCGSCWACTAVKSTEAEVAIGTGKKTALSIQQVIDCAAIEGCRGGTLDQAYNYMTEAGITTEKAYPGPPGDARSLLYGIFSGYCQMKGKPVAVRIGGYIRIPASERSFMSALQSGPIAVYLNVNKAFAQLGPDGVLEVEMCPPFAEKPEGAHCVLLVGYGTDELGRRYWKVLNSWGPGWGKGGYGKLRRGTHPLGVAGITEYAGFRPVSVELVDLP